MALWQYQQKAEPLFTGAAPVVPDVSSWQPQNPDQVPRASRITTAVLATAIAVFVPAPSALEAAASATYPDQIQRVQTHPSRQQFLALHPDPIAAPPVVPEQWAPSYPDRLTRPALHASQQQAWTGTTRTDQQAPSAPASSGVVYRPAQIQYQSLTGPVLVPAVTPELSWAPEYPDQHLRRLQPAALHLASVLSPEPITVVAAPDLSWSPRYPDQHLQRLVPVSQQRAFFFDPEPIPNPPAPELSWTPVYPSLLLPARALLASQQQAFAFYAVPIPGAATTTLHRLLLSLTTEVAAPTPAPELSWIPTYPSRFPPRPWNVALRTWRTEPFAPAQAPPELSWAPDYPDRLIRLVLPVTLQQSLAFYTEPVAAVVIEGLPWYPTFPDLLLPREYLTALQQAFAANLDPISTAALVPLSWDPHYPHLLLPLRRALDPGGMAAPPPSETATTIAGLWRPTYPTFIWRLPSPIAPTPILVIPLAPLANAITCIEVTNLGVTQPQVLTPAVTQATILTLTVTQPEILSLEVC